MPNCFSCNSPFVSGARFCSSCGRNFQSKQNSVGTKKNAPRNLRNEQAILAISHIKKSKGTKALTTAALGLTTAAVMAAITAHSGVSLFIPGIVAVVSILAAIVLKGFGPRDYYAVAGTKNANGEHVCVYCGGQGIWRSTPYKTNSTLCRCSKCKSLLYTE